MPKCECGAELIIIEKNGEPHFIACPVCDLDLTQYKKSVEVQNASQYRS